MSMSISSMSSAAQMLQARDKTFDALDTNKDGVVDASELAAAKKGDESSKKTAKADDLFSKIDSDGDGKMSRAESDAFKQKIADGMKGTLLQAQEQGSTDASAATPSEDDMFAKLDANGDGSVDKSEFEAGFKAHGHHHHHRPSADEMMTKLDTDGDGAISKSEFEAGPNRAKNSDTSSSTGSNDPASQLLDLLKKAADDASSQQSTTQVSMVAVLLQVQETSAIAA